MEIRFSSVKHTCQVPQVISIYDLLFNVMKYESLLPRDMPNATLLWYQCPMLLRMVWQILNKQIAFLTIRRMPISNYPVGHVEVGVIFIYLCIFSRISSFFRLLKQFYQTIGIRILKIRRSRDRLIFDMGIWERQSLLWDGDRFLP